ncbi:MAG: hypothetical protein A2X64_03785 [Ignavibacteria bacterium GWF2_33_9]|nr:MAG: hypothetical protein A2X64_03785 [Ignavibacteria bacterium GWF2_33_9]
MVNIIQKFCKDFEILPINTSVILEFALDGITKWKGGEDHTVILSCSNRAVSLSTKKVIIEEGMSFKTTIQSSKVGTALIEISVDGKTNSKVQIKFSDSKDVFSKIKFDLLMSELKYVAPEVNSVQPHAEYASNYCMAASERGLSELLNDTTNFYAVERVTHKRKNQVSFSGKTAIDRGKQFQRLGYTEIIHHFKGYKVVNSKKDMIYKAKDESDAKTQYSNVKFDIIEFNATGKNVLAKHFENDVINKEIGYHVYYFTVTDGFHTLILIIDKFTDPCNPKYEIWDQHGLTSSYGLLSDIAEGIRRQTSWTFANSCLNRYLTNKTQYVDSTDTYLWKIKEKS